MSRVLLTRPMRDSAAFAARLAQAGHEAVISPVIEIAAMAGLQETDLYCETLLATSAHAFEFLPDGHVQALRSKPLYLVGERTAAAARQRGFSAVQFVAPDGAALVAMIKDRRSLPGEMLYLAGRERKLLLERELSHAGAAVQVAEVYCAKLAVDLSATAQDALQAGTLDAAMHFSRRSAEIFCALVTRAGLAQQARAMRHICLSQDVALGLASLDAGSICVAARPDGEAMIAVFKLPA